MKNNYLRVLFLICLWLVLSMPVMAAEVIELDLETAVDMALENNLDYQVATINYERSKLEYQKKIANSLLQPSQYSKVEAEISLNSAENTYRNTRYQIVNNIINQYTDLWLAGLDLDIKNKSVELEQLRLQEAQAQYEIGDIGSIDLLDQENAYKDARFNLENARDDYQQGIREFMMTLNLEDTQVDNTELLLSDLVYTESWPITEEKALEIALKNSVELRLTKMQLELAEIDLERAAVSAAELDKKIKEKSVEAARLEVEKTRREVVNNTQQTYYQFKQAVKRIDLTKERLTGAEEKYKLREEQYKAGLITRIEVLEYETNMLQARYNYLSAIADYYLQEQNLRQNMGLEAGVVPDEITADN